jgi:hypothetical protein
MTEQLRKEAHEFMFKEFGKSIWWEIKDLTPEGNPAGNPPNLNRAEAESIFHDLFKMDLVIPTKNKDGEDCFIIHQARRKEWEDLIDPPNILQRNKKQILIWLVAFILWFSSILISAYLTKKVENRVDQIENQSLKRQTDDKQDGQSKVDTSDKK